MPIYHLQSYISSLSSLPSTLSSSELLPTRFIGKVVRGYGRGSADLGIPTANLGLDQTLRIRTARECPTDAVPSSEVKSPFASNHLDVLGNLPTGIYWGYARVVPSNGDDTAPTLRFSTATYPAAISVGTNPTYGNDHVTIEPHLIDFSGNSRHSSSCGETILPEFYGSTLRLSMVGFIRDELRFDGLESLISAIKNDILKAEAECEIDKGTDPSKGDGTKSKEFLWVRGNDDI